MDSHQMGEIDLGVNLSCGERAVAEEFLDRPKVHAGFQQVGGKGVTQCVRVEMVEVCRVEDGTVELAADGSVAEAAPSLVDEEWVALVGEPSAPAGAIGKIGLDGPCCRPAERHEALLASFAAHPDHPLTELDITEIESHEFTDAKPCGVKKLHRSAVTAPGGAVRKSLQKFLDCVAVGDLRCSLDIVGMGHGICRARLEGALGYQEAKKGAESGKCACDGSRLETARVEVSEVGPNRDGRRLGGLFLVELRGDEIDKGEHFAAIGAKGCGGEVAFPFEVFQKGVDQPWAEVVITGGVAHSRAFGRAASFPEALHHHRRRVSPNISIECLTAITRDAST